MRRFLSKDFRFEAAHFLPFVPDVHKCKRMHGHSYFVRVTISGDLEPTLGWVLDLGQLSSIVDQLIGPLDHRTLNDIAGLENPTAEILTSWIWERVAIALPLVAQLYEVEVRETAKSRVLLRAD